MENENEKEQSDLNSWSGYLGTNFLKAENVTNEDQPFICVAVTETEDQRPRLTLENNEIVYLFDLNVTNAQTLKRLGVKSPKNAIGIKIFFRKTWVTSPKTKKEVETLRIKDIVLNPTF